MSTRVLHFTFATPLAALVLAASPALAASGGAPLSLTHSGLLLDGSDTPVTSASETMVFRVFDAVAAGNLQWEGTCSGVEVSAGRYSVVLGSAGCVGTTAEGVDPVLDTNDLPPGAGRWLEIAIQNITLTPRMAFSSVPNATVAARALDAELLDGHAAEEFAAALHTHDVADLDGLDAALTTAKVPWASLTGVPSTFAPADHTHAADALTSGTIANARLSTGHGGGLDADSVDGRHASEFAEAGHTHAAADVSAAVQDLFASAGFAVEGVVTTGVVSAGGGVKVGSSDVACDASREGLLRYDATTKSMLFCNGSAWRGFAPPAAEIVVAGTGRRFSDGTYAASCDRYRNPPNGYAYSGATGDGVYTIAPVSAAAPFDVLCDMTTSGGGWTLVSNASTVSIAFPNVAGTDTSTNFDVDGLFSPTVPKLVKLNGTSVLGVFSYDAPGVWKSGAMTLGANNVRYSGNADSVWLVHGVPYGTLGPANHGTWCNTSTPITIYMNTLVHVAGGVHAGVQASQGGCTDNAVWKDDFSWQVYSK